MAEKKKQNSKKAVSAKKAAPCSLTLDNSSKISLFVTIKKLQGFLFLLVGARRPACKILFN